MKGGKVKTSGQETLTEVVAVFQVWVKERPRGWERGNTDDGVLSVMSEQVGEKMSSFFLTSHLKKLIYNGALGSGVQKSDSFIHIKYTFFQIQF